MMFVGVIGGGAVEIPTVEGDADWANVLAQASWRSMPGGFGIDEGPLRLQTTETNGSPINTDPIFGRGSWDLNTDGRFVIPASTRNLNTEWTLYVTHRPDAFTGGQQVICNKWLSSTGNRGFILRDDRSNNRLQLLYSTTGSNTVTNNYTFTAVADTEYDFILSYNPTGGLFKVWVNRTLAFDLSGVSLHNNSSVDWTLGRYVATGVDSVVGQLDRFRLRAGAVTSAESDPTDDWTLQEHIPNINSYWTDHSIVLDNKLYISTADRGGAQLAWEVSPGEDRVVTDDVGLYDGYAVDDHNAAAIERMGNGDLIFAYTGHNDDGNLRVRTGADFDNLGSETVLTNGGTGGNFTYCQIHVRGNEVYLFTRNGSDDWSIFYSTNNGSTWSSRIAWFDSTGQSYILTRRLDNDTLRFVLVGHPSEAGPIKLGEIDLGTGDITSGGSSLGNFKTATSLPVAWASFTTIRAAPGSGVHRVLDFSDDGERIIIYTSVDDSYKMLTITDTAFGSAWTADTIRTAGGYFSAANNYVGGACFDRSKTTNDLIVSYLDTGTWYIRPYTRTGAGSYTAGTVENSSTNPLVRPMSPRNASTWFPYFYQELKDWTDYDNYGSNWIRFPAVTP